MLLKSMDHSQPEAKNFYSNVQFFLILFLHLVTQLDCQICFTKKIQIYKSDLYPPYTHTCFFLMSFLQNSLFRSSNEK